MSRRTRGAAASALALTALTTFSGCSGAVDVASPDLSAADRGTCEALLDDVPAALAGLEEQEVDPTDAPARAWGEGLVLQCGAAEPEEYPNGGSCQEIVGVGWFVPSDQLDDETVTLTATAVGHRPRLDLVVPPEHRGQVSLDALTALAGPVEEHLELVEPCL